MTAPEGYSAEEWKAVTEAPIMAGTLVSIADMSGPVGLVQEASAMLKSSVESGLRSPSEVIKAVAEQLKDQKKPDTPDLPKDRAQAKAALIDGCKRAAEIVAQHSPDEAEPYRQWLFGVATATANAAKEGTFLGFGGTRVSEGERSVLDELATALGVSGSSG
jgi:hypothetical protein